MRQKNIVERELKENEIVYHVLEDKADEFLLGNITKEEYEQQGKKISNKLGQVNPIWKNKNQVFYFVDVWKDFIEDYCRDDVLILGLSVYKHQEIFNKISNQLLREQQLKRFLIHLKETWDEVDEKDFILKDDAIYNEELRMMYPLNQNPDYCYNRKDKQGDNEVLNNENELLLDGYNVLDEVKHIQSKKHYTIERIEEDLDTEYDMTTYHLIDLSGNRITVFKHEIKV